MNEDNELIKNRKIIYQNAYNLSEDKKTNILLSLSGTSFTGLGIASIVSSISAPTGWAAIASIFGVASLSVNPIGVVIGGVSILSSIAIPAFTISKKNKNKAKDAVSKINVEDSDKNFFHILFYPSLYLIEQISNNKEDRINELKKEMRKYETEENIEVFINDFLALSKEDKEKQISKSTEIMKKEPLQYFIQESVALCNKIRDNEAQNKSEYDKEIKNIFKIVVSGLSIDKFSEEDRIGGLCILYTLLFFMDNEDRLNTSRENIDNYHEKINFVKKIDNSRNLKKAIDDYLKSCIREEKDLNYVRKIPYEYSKMINETLQDCKAKSIKNESFEPALNDYIKNIVGSFEKKSKEIIEREYPLLKNKENLYLLDKLKVWKKKMNF